MSSTINSTLSSLSAKTGMGGLVSGMDTDELVKSMTAISRQKILKQQQSLQQLQWKQTGYRSVTNALRTFQTNFLDVLSKTNLRSTSTFNTVKASTSSSAFSVSATSAAASGKIVINKITQLATNEKIQTLNGATADMTLSGLSSMSATDADILLNKSISVTLDVTVKAITFDADFVDAVKSGSNENIAQQMQRLLDKAFGTYNVNGVTKSRVTVSNDLKLSSSGSQITVNAVGEDTPTLEALGLKPGQSTKLSMTAEIDTLDFATPLSEDDTFKFTINGETFEFSRGTSINKIISQVNNNSKAGVKLSYSAVSDKFTITSNTAGSGENIKISQEKGNLLTAMGLVDASGEFSDRIAGSSAILEVDGQQIVRDNNSFEINGVKIELKETTDTPATIELKNDASDLKETIKKFVEDYNAMITLTSGLTTEKVYSDYAPLSDEQKEDMTETQIKQWEEKAKSGMLNNDRILTNLVSKLQTTLASANVNGFSLYSMGITTGGYGSNGKLKIDEEKLDKALSENADQVKDFFTDGDGFGNKLNTLIDSYVKTSGTRGSRGILIEAAGIESTRSDTENNINDSITRANKLIETLKERLEREEKRYWSQFTAMESALEKLNAQSSILMQFSGNSN